MNIGAVLLAEEPRTGSERTTSFSTTSAASRLIRRVAEKIAHSGAEGVVENRYRSDPGVTEEDYCRRWLLGLRGAFVGHPAGSPEAKQLNLTRLVCVEPFQQRAGG